MISDVAMGFIAFSIGNEFRLSQLKKTGRQAMIIASCRRWPRWPLSTLRS